jgi:multiple sugar transport system substrate-binding protein
MSPRKVIATALALTFATALAGCGSGATKTLTWWTLPDRVGATALARDCGDVGGGYRVDVRPLPTNLADRRADLIRRLSAGDNGVDILSLDSALTAEFAAAGFLAPLPSKLRSTAGLIPRAVEAASYKGTMVAVPWWIDPQVLWFRGAAAERAGIDTNRSVSWDKLLAGANRIRASVQFADADGTGMSDWVRGLVAESRGSVLDGTGRNAEVGLKTDAGRVAAGIVQFYAASGVGPGPSSHAFAEFAGTRGAFLLARASARTEPALASVSGDMKAVPYPVIDGLSIAPLSGAALAVPASSDRQSEAFKVIECLTSLQTEVRAMRNSGLGSARTFVYGSSAVTDNVPQADLFLTAANSGVNVPSSPHWFRAEQALRTSWTPLSDVTTRSTPKKSAAAVKAAVKGGLS